MFYVQHLLGVGHLARAALICDGLAENGCDVLMVTGGRPVTHLFPRTAKVMQLPSLHVASASFESLLDSNGQPATQRYLSSRRDQLLAAFTAFQPDVLIIEAFPFGRRMMRFELMPLLQLAQATAPHPKIICSVRDILQQNRKAKRLTETVDVLNTYFDQVLVHGDPEFARLDETFPLTDQISHMTTYTGLVVGRPDTQIEQAFDIVVSPGSGKTAHQIIKTAVAVAKMEQFSSLRWCLIVDRTKFPLDTEWPKNITTIDHHDNFTGLLASARLSISQAGYNTMGDILVSGCLAIVIPFAEQGETEQPMRAQKLEQLQRVVSLPVKNLNRHELSVQIARLLETGQTWQAEKLPDLAGVGVTVSNICRP